MALIPKFFMEAVVSIGLRNGAAINWIGTGFFVVKPLDDDKFQPFMVTNRHVLQGNDSVVIRLKENTTGALKILDMPLKSNAKTLYSVHEDQDVDIAGVLLNGKI